MSTHMHLKISFRDNRPPIVVCRIEIDTGQALWERLDPEDYPKLSKDDEFFSSGQIRLEEIKTIQPFSFFQLLKNDGEGVTE